MNVWDSLTDGLTAAYNSAAGSVEEVYDSAVGGFSSLFEDSENAPQTYQQTAAYEATASGAVSTSTPYAQTNTGATVAPVASASSYTPYLIGGGILLTVLVVGLLVVKGK